MIEKKKVLALFIVLIILTLLFIGSLICSIDFGTYIPEGVKEGENAENILGVFLAHIFGNFFLIPIKAMYGVGALLYLFLAIVLFFAKSADMLESVCKGTMLLLATCLSVFLALQIGFIAIMSATALPLTLGILTLIAYIAALTLAVTTRKYAKSINCETTNLQNV